MPTLRIRPYRDKNRPWLKHVVNLKPGRKRKFFTTKSEAETFVQLRNVELLNQGAESQMFPTELRILAQKANEILAPFGKSVLDAANFFLPHLQAANKSCTVNALKAELLKAQGVDGSKPRYLEDIESRLGQFCATYGETLVANISTPQLDDWLRERPVGPVTRNNFRRILIRAFSYAQSRGYCVSNPAKATKKAKETKRAAGILTVDQTADLLTHSGTQILPGVALGLFAGIRPEAEGQHLDWSHIDFSDKTIDVEPDKTKADSSARYVDMSDNLIAWLLPHRKRKGPVFPAIGEYYTSLQKARDAAGIKEWPHDALRHSFGSYHYGSHRSAALTQAQMGHTNAQIFFKHYRKPMKKSVADRYWKIMPANVKGARKKLVPFKAAA